MVKPRRDSARDVRFPDDLEVLGVSAGGEARAYLLTTLEATENHVVDDVVGGAPVSVTYCDRTGCARAFSLGEDGRPLGLRAWGFSAEGGMILDTGEGLYFQHSGRPASPGTSGPFPYRELPSLRATWGEWTRRHPDSAVVYYPCLATEAWAGVYPDRLVEVPPEDEVVGVAVNGRCRAYLLRAFSRAANFVIHDGLGGVELTVVRCVRQDRAVAYVRARPGVPPITFAGWAAHSGRILLESGGRLYDGQDRAASDGGGPEEFPYREVPLVRTTWAEWKAAHPDTTVYVGDLREVVRIPPTAEGSTLVTLADLGRLLAFAPAGVLLLAICLRRLTRRSRPAGGETPPGDAH